MYSCEHMHVYKKVLSVSTSQGKDICEFAQHRFITKVFMVQHLQACEYMHVCIIRYMCGYMHVYKEVRSVSTRKGTDICEFAHDGFVYKSFYDLKNVYLRVFTCKQRGSNCERLQGHRHM